MDRTHTPRRVRQRVEKNHEEGRRVSQQPLPSWAWRKSSSHWLTRIGRGRSPRRDPPGEEYRQPCTCHATSREYGGIVASNRAVFASWRWPRRSRARTHVCSGDFCHGTLRSTRSNSVMVVELGGHESRGCCGGGLRSPRCLCRG